VRSAHEQLKQLVLAGYWPVVVGQRGHVEVRGLTGDFPHAAILESLSDIEQVPPRPRYGVISQTTQPIEYVQGLVDALRKNFPQSEVRFVDTVCQPTKNRQSALHKLIAAVEVVVVVGGRDSNNTRQLVATCRAAGRRAIHIERPEELQPADFDGVNIVGLTAGTSTLRETVTAVQVRLQEIAKCKEQLLSGCRIQRDDERKAVAPLKDVE
jgi:4-hydroxy-3-methylbut-2-enyl diphosphate reductase